MNALKWIARALPVLLAVLLIIGFVGTSWGQTVPPVLTVSVVVDPVTRDKLGQQATDAWIDTAMGAAADVYSKQLGLQLLVARTDYAHVSDDTQPIFILDKLSKIRSADTLMYDTGVTIFFTDRELRIGRQYYEGYASYGPMCSPQAVVVMSFEADSYTTAHELGHVFGAPHDGEGACWNTPKTGFLMQEIGSGSTEFSQCSKDVIKQSIKDTPCLTRPGLCGACSPPPPIQKSGAGSFDDALIGFLVGMCFILYVTRRRR